MMLRIALCGYPGEGHDALITLGWKAVSWKARGGYGSIGHGRGRDNSKRETIWFSQHCLRDKQGSLFDWAKGRNAKNKNRVDRRNVEPCNRVPAHVQVLLRT